jgi:integrase
MMSGTYRPRGHLQVKLDANGRTRAFWAFWREQDDSKRGRRLGLAHVRDSGRRTARGAIVWRAGYGEKPGPEYVTPQEAEDQLQEILSALRAGAQDRELEQTRGSLRQATEGWLAERQSEKGLKRSTIAGYEDMFERLYRDLGADTPVRELADGRLRDYFADFKSFRVLGESAAQKALGEGRDVRKVPVQRWTAQPPGSQAVEVASKAEAERLASELPGTWKHRRRGAYRVVPLNAERPRRVSHATAEALEAEGWIIGRRTAARWMLVAPAAAQTRNAYRDILGAILDHAVRQRWLDANPLAEVKRTNKRRERERILRRDDFYDPDEVDRLLQHAPGVLEEAFWLCGAHAGFRLPGEAQGIRWGAVDFQAGVIRPYDNWVRNAPDTTKTSDSEAIPMTPRLTRALEGLKQRVFATGNEDFVFASELRDGPVSERPIREAFKLAQQKAALKPIRMYNLRHSFGTTLACNRVDVRTIQALMRHDRLSTTEQYMAYAPQPELASQITRALDPHSLPARVSPIHASLGAPASTFLERLEEEIPAKWLREVQRLYTETVVRP